MLADARDRLFIADSNHHQIVVAGYDGRVLDRDRQRTPGSGATATSSSAEFHKPQGLALVGDTLYVADTENHLIRAVDLTERSGDDRWRAPGEQCTWREEGGRATLTALNSPWDLAVVGRLLFIAMAGPHQIWMLDRDARDPVAVRRIGQEARIDGTIEEAAFAQPSGLAVSTATCMYVADAESNIIRAIDLPPANRVRTLAGGDLFEFGDVDGKGDAVRLQHPLGLAISRRPRRHRRHLQPQDQAAGSRNGEGLDACRHRDARPHRRQGPEGAVLRAGRHQRGRRHHLRRRHEQSRDTESGCQDRGDGDDSGAIGAIGAEVHSCDRLSGCGRCDQVREVRERRARGAGDAPCAPLAPYAPYAA